MAIESGKVSACKERGSKVRSVSVKCLSGAVPLNGKDAELLSNSAIISLLAAAASFTHAAIVVLFPRNLRHLLSKQPLAFDFNLLKAVSNIASEDQISTSCDLVFNAFSSRSISVAAAAQNKHSQHQLNRSGSHRHSSISNTT